VNRELVHVEGQSTTVVFPQYFQVGHKVIGVDGLVEGLYVLNPSLLRNRSDGGSVALVDLDLVHV
jgi:hypothetical protein